MRLKIHSWAKCPCLCGNIMRIEAFANSDIRAQCNGSPQMSTQPSLGQIPGLPEHVQIPLIHLVWSLIHCLLTATKYFKVWTCYHSAMTPAPHGGWAFFFFFLSLHSEQRTTQQWIFLGIFFILCILDHFFQRRLYLLWLEQVLLDKPLESVASFRLFAAVWA